MKKKFFCLAVLCCLFLVIFSACDAQDTGSLKSVTHPYIAQYECTQATLGEANLLEKYDYIKIILVDREQLEVVFKPKNGKKQVFKSNYSVDEETNELTGEIGILGFRFRQSVIIEDGKFTISQKMGNVQLIMNFEAK